MSVVASLTPVTLEHLTLSEWLQVVQIGVIVLGGVAMLATLRSNVRELTRRVVGVETDVKKLVEVLVALARQDERLDALNRRVELVEARPTP